MTADEIAREWDAEAGIRSDPEQLAEGLRSAADRWDIAGHAPQGIADEALWLAYEQALETGDVAAILAGRTQWGLPPLV